MTDKTRGPLPLTGEGTPSDSPSKTTQGTQNNTDHDARRSEDGQPAANSSTPSELTQLKLSLRLGLRQYPDFPAKGVLFEDICPLFRDPGLLAALVRALELFVVNGHGNGGPGRPDVIVGLDARGFLMGPTLAFRLGIGFVPVRKIGKLPGATETVTYRKEYGEDSFQIQADSIAPGQKVIILDDVIATGGSAAAAGNLVRKIGGQLLGYVFLLELEFLKGRDKLDAPVYTLLSGQSTTERG